MSKWIECLVVASAVVLVECEDDDETPEETAMNIAGNEAFEGGGFDEISCRVITGDEEIDRAKRHAELVIPLD